jgi:cytoskeletal protein RodZ
MIPSDAPTQFPGLVEWRAKNGVTLAAVAAATKISPRYLDAIESGNFLRLPGGIYGLNYIRQYARAIAFSEEDLVDAYRSAVEPPETPAAVAPPSAGRVGRLRVLVRSLRVAAHCAMAPVARS